MFDSDFASTDDEAADPLDPDILERRLRREERTEKKKERKKGYHDPLAYLKKGARGKSGTKSGKKVVVDASIGGAGDTEVQAGQEEEELEEEERHLKRRRVTFPDEHPSIHSYSPVPAPGPAEGYTGGEHEDEPTMKPSGRRGGLGRKTVQGEVRRSALRESTRKDREGLDEREKEEEARRVGFPRLLFFFECRLGYLGVSSADPDELCLRAGRSSTPGPEETAPQ